MSGSISIASSIFNGQTTIGTYVPIYNYEEKTIAEIKGKNPILRTEYGDIDLKLFIEMMSQLADILCMAKANLAQIEEYPALENAYLHYKIVERLVRDPQK